MDETTILQNLLQLSSQIEKAAEQISCFILPEIKRHNDSIESIKREIEDLKAEIQKQGELVSFLKHPISS